MVMEDLSKATLLLGTPLVSFWRVYVDDCLGVVHQDNIPKVLELLNSHDPTGLQFELEMEDNNRINFLDMTVINTGAKLDTNWYQKENATSKRLQHSSVHPEGMKVGVAKTFARSVLALSSPKYHHQNIGRIHRVLRSNQYPPKVIEGAVKYAAQSMRQPQRAVRETRTKVGYRSMAYVPPLFNAVKRVIDASGLSDYSIVPRPVNKLRGVFSHVKDPLPPESFTNCVVKIPCLGCEKYCIVYTSEGQNIGRLKQDIMDHGTIPQDARVHGHFVATGHRLNTDTLRLLSRNCRPHLIRSIRDNYARGPQPLCLNAVNTDTNRAKLLDVLSKP